MYFHSKGDLFSDLSFGELCCCQSTFYLLFIRREHLVNTEKT